MLKVKENKYVKGDKAVAICCDEQLEEMRKFVGQEVEIHSLFCKTERGNWYAVEENGFIWLEDWLEPANKKEIQIETENILDLFGG